jgi:hypothetical protein
MAAKKKTTKKPIKTKPKPKRTARKKATARQAEQRRKKLAKRKPAPKRAEKKTTAASKQPGKRADQQSGDLQGLSRLEAADSESVEELIEEGNAFEADVVAGVESADDADEKEVRTHEVPEDDVPGEYLDKD